MTLYKKNVRALVVEPANQQPAYEKARPNGNLGPAYIVGALREHGVEADYIDATVGPVGSDLKKTFFLRTEMENGNSRFGMSLDELPDIISKYDIVATSSPAPGAASSPCCAPCPSSSAPCRPRNRS